MGTIPHLACSLAQAIDNIRQFEKSLAVSPIVQVVEAIERDRQRMVDFLRGGERLTKVYGVLRPRLADMGWYLGLSLYPQQYLKLAKAAKEGKEDVIEEFMRHHTCSRMDRTLNAAVHLWPERSDILRDAFEAHEEGKYTLSVPTLLAQVDGICFEILGVNLFYKRRNLPTEISRKLSPPTKCDFWGERIVFGALVDALLDTLREPSSVQANEKTRREERAKNPQYGPLNRHEVLHGTNLSYATEGDNLRAILLIDYLVEVKDVLDRESAAQP